MVPKAVAEATAAAAASIRHDQEQQYDQAKVHTATEQLGSVSKTVAAGSAAHTALEPDKGIQGDPQETSNAPNTATIIGVLAGAALGAAVAVGLAGVPGGQRAPSLPPTTVCMQCRGPFERGRAKHWAQCTECKNYWHADCPMTHAPSKEQEYGRRPWFCKACKAKVQ